MEEFNSAPLGELLSDIAEARARLSMVLDVNAEQRARMMEVCRALRETMMTIGRRNGPPPAPIQLYTARPAVVSRSNDKIEALTKREVEVLKLIAEGLSTKEIAGRLNISFKTAVSHRTHLLQKLGAHESATLIRIAIRAGLVAA